MKEITRIHIAKVSYDIEIGAKKELEKYINNLEAYANDQELLQDIEIRITELLEARGVKQNDVITSDDVAAVREQLGEPKEFMGDGDIAVGPEVELSGEATRKLYRNTDSAVLGGVLSGVAGFFRINPLWVRLIFIILLFASAGAVLLVYIVLWIALPPARTAAEKLQMTGRPVTLASIRELNEDQSGLEAQYRRASMLRRAGTTTLGIISSFAAVVTLIVLISAVVGILVFRGGSVDGGIWGAGLTYTVAVILAAISGLLLVSLFSLGAYAAFARKFTKRLLVSVIVVVASGLVLFGSAVGMVGYDRYQTEMKIQQKMKNLTVAVPDGFNKISHLEIGDMEGALVNYVVDTNPRIEVIGTVDTKTQLSIDGQTARLSVSDTDKEVIPAVTIFGPALQSISSSGGHISYQATAQDNLLVSTEADLVVTGVYKTVTLVADGRGNIDAKGASIENAIVTTREGSRVTLGAIKTLKAHQSDVCSGYGDSSLINVTAMIDTMYTRNDQQLSAKDNKTSCGEVTFGDNYNASHQPSMRY